LNSGIRQLVSQYLFRSPTATKITFASSGGLLLGGLGGFLFVNRNQTGHHQSETECDCEHQTQNNCDSSELLLAQTPISELSLIQQLKLVARFLFLSVLFSPAVILYGVSFLTGSRDAEYLAWKYVYFTIQLAGPAFIKLGQWASTRRDMFSEDFCRALSKLHTRCSPHSWRATEQLLCENFGEDWEEKVVILDHNAIGSGCVAQVYQGYLRTEQSNKKVERDGVLEDKVIPEGEVGLRDLREAALMADRGYTPVAVKVLHPGIVEAMDGDIRLMKYVASWMDYVYPDLHWIALKECVDEFSMVMQQQVSK
jgi:aarF domain-containing kinase